MTAVPESTDLTALAAADLRETAATLRDILGQADAVSQRLAATVSAAAVLMGQIQSYQRAQRLLLDVHGALVPAGGNGKGGDGG